MPYTGIISNEPALDHTGPMTRDVISNALLLRVIAGTDDIDGRQLGAPAPSHVPDYPALLSAARTGRALLSVGKAVTTTDAEPGSTRSLRIGILKEGVEGQHLDPRIVECVRAAAKKFQELGAEVIDVSVPGHTIAPLIGRAQRCVNYALSFP